MKTSSLLAFSLLISTASIAQKKVLIEQFTNAGCPPCATYTPQVTNYVKANPDKLILISYHTSFPYLDSMYHENKAESNAAVGYYSVPSVPSTIVDGNHFQNSSSVFLNQPDVVVAPRYSAATFGTIELGNYAINNGTLNVTVKLNLTAGLNPSDYTVKVVIVEQKVLKSSYAASPGKNTETEYHYVMRKMLPDFDGVTPSSSNYQENYNWNIKNIKNLSEIRVIAFVQNKSTKEIGAVEMSGMSAAGINSTELNSTLISLYPNPTNELLNVNFSDDSTTEFTFLITDSNGKQIRSEKFQNGNNTINISDLESGFYLLSLQKGTEVVASKRFIKK